jgi:hypothetical protein
VGLQWEDSKNKYAEIQVLSGGELARIGTVGDGNCLLHSFLFALSPTYRAHNKAARSIIADAFRNILKAREEELRNLADVTYPEIGGAAALEENFEILKRTRDRSGKEDIELNIEMAPLIAQLYGFNLLAVQVREDMSLHPVCATYISYNPELPTVLVNYIGGGLDIGNAAQGFMEGGHYEAIFAPTLVPVVEEAPPVGKRTTRKRKEEAPRVSLDLVKTQFTFRHSEIHGLLAKFERACKPELSAEAAALMAEIEARKMAAVATANANVNANLAAALAASLALRSSSTKSRRSSSTKSRRSSSGRHKTRKSSKNRT